jgi:hypothetical protein
MPGHPLHPVLRSDIPTIHVHHLILLMLLSQGLHPPGHDAKLFLLITTGTIEVCDFLQHEP